MRRSCVVVAVLAVLVGGCAKSWNVSRARSYEGSLVEAADRMNAAVQSGDRRYCTDPRSTSRLGEIERGFRSVDDERLRYQADRAVGFAWTALRDCAVGAPVSKVIDDLNEYNVAANEVRRRIDDLQIERGSIWDLLAFVLPVAAFALLAVVLGIGAVIDRLRSRGGVRLKDVAIR